MKTRYIVLLLSGILLFVQEATAHPPGSHPPCDPEELVGVWRINDYGDGNSVEPGRHIALARSGHEFDAIGFHITEYTVVGMGFGKLNEGKAFGFCHHDKQGLNHTYVAYTIVSSGDDTHLVAITPHSVYQGGRKPDFDDLACKKAADPKNCSDYFIKLQDRFLAIKTIKSDGDLTTFTNRSDFLSFALGKLKPQDFGDGHSHGGSGRP